MSGRPGTHRSADGTGESRLSAVVRTIADLGGDVVGEVVVAVIALVVVGGTVAALGWGWQRNKPVTAVAAAALVAFVVIGARSIATVVRGGEMRGGHFAALASVATTLVLVWLYYVKIA